MDAGSINEKFDNFSEELSKRFMVLDDAVNPDKLFKELSPYVTFLDEK